MIGRHTILTMLMSKSLNPHLNPRRPPRTALRNRETRRGADLQDRGDRPGRYLRDRGATLIGRHSILSMHILKSVNPHLNPRRPSRTALRNRENRRGRIFGTAATVEDGSSGPRRPPRTDLRGRGDRQLTDLRDHDDRRGPLKTFALRKLSGIRGGAGALWLVGTAF